MILGDYRVEVIPDAEFKLDGGAMFGVVPRVLWERVTPADDFNRVTLNCNCLFIDTGKEKLIIETGMGEKWSPREIEMYGITRERPFAESLRRIAGCGPNDIDIVINTHLHFDHAGGNTVTSSPPYAVGGPTGNTGTSSVPERGVDDASSDGVVLSPMAQFKNARYLVSKTEFQHAEQPHERDRASYLDENWQPLIDSQQLDLMPDKYEPVEGLKVEQVRGHSETMQTIRLTRGGETLFGFFDMVPTRHHLSPAWIMSYDLYPTETLEFKKRVLPQALEENWICHFYHDTEIPLGRLAEVNGKITAIALEQ
ncbi:MAG TPA: MBL fold metallo-hydrolase [Pyrinomonadaceae bacterium]|jgi:glyoxylase-like metal-dependent hydrolase (beta-lactamase superfamily II)|nr:MBL fold metallo-hydrolase [Pyrinomonadaceae bacterium]